MNSEIHVAVAAIIDQTQKVLITRRPDHVHQGGLWEFPGGKLEPGEQVVQALRREIAEEVGLRVLKAQPLIQIHHDYGDKKVHLDVWMVTQFEGSPQGKEGQAWRWVSRKALRNFQFPAANQAIIDALLLPEYYLITPEPGNNLASFLHQLEVVLSGEPRITLVQLRAKQLATQDFVQCAERAIEICHARGVQLLLNAEPSLALTLGADGVHLTSQRLLAISRRPLPAPYWVSASCHNETEICHAAKIGANFTVLAPVLATQSHPGAASLGWERFARLVSVSSIPVYALGGVAPRDIETAKVHGAQGIAGIRAFWQFDDVV